MSMGMFKKYKILYCLYSFTALFLLYFSREQRENQGGVARQGRRLRAQTKNEDGEFATGLIIGQKTFRHYILKIKSQGFCCEKCTTLVWKYVVTCY